MRLLLDTHALIWCATDNANIGPKAREIIVDPANEVFVSIVSFWEMAIKLRAGKLIDPDLGEVMIAATGLGIGVLQLSLAHVRELLRLPVHPDHGDPFEHQIIAQAIAEDFVLLTNDRNAARYPVKRMTCSGKFAGT
ncbi:MAG TPA: type II toxin-antitoxin system VapC family toxin [Rhizomicrobium sp.]|nr:type II toxin-antitoxin system VapC family toxin [Rhizomicrobium sp.]